MQVERLFDWLFPRRCGLCELVDEASLCSFCSGEFALAKRWDRAEGRAYDEAFVLFEFTGRVRQAVHSLKFHRITSLGAPLSQLMVKAALDERIEHFDAVVPVPIHWRRQWARGFNQSILLASGFPASVVKLDWLKRIRNTPAQAGLGLEARRHNLADAFQATAAVRRKRILLLDDVLTSGSTANECAKALKNAGAAQVTAFALSGSTIGNDL